MPKARFLHALFLAASLARGARAQDNRLVEADMQFARALAARFSYVDLADEVVASIDRRGLTPGDVARLGLLECDVVASGARAEPSAKKRLELYDKALERYQSFLANHKGAEILREAQRSYVALVNDYGRSLEVELETAVGAEAAQLRDKIRNVLKGGIDLTGDLIEASRGDVSEARKQERWKLMLDRGHMLLTLARVSESGVFLFDQAEKTLENLALEAGETSGAGLNAYLTLAEVKAAQGEYGLALDFAEFVYQVVLPDTPERRTELGWTEASREEKTGRFRLGELVLPTLIEASVAQGNTEKACASALHFHNTWKQEDLELTPKGSLALLACARLLLDAGGFVGGDPAKGDLHWFDSEEAATAAGHALNKDLKSGLEFALAIAQQVNAENKGNTLQVRAQRVISEVISRPGVSVSPDLLFEAAQGEYFAKDHPKAIESLKGILRVLEPKDRATQEAHVPKVLFFLGSALAGMERHLEAAMAFREGATRWKSDAETLEKLARGYYAEMGALRDESGNDPLFAKLYLEAEGLLSSAAASTSDRGEILLRQAERKFREEKDYAGARALYAEIERGSDLHEKGWTMAALCLYKQGEFDAAQADFLRYLAYTKDPATKPTGGTARASREEALAIATFYLGRIAYERSDYAQVIEILGPFDTTFPGQSDYGPNALYMVVLSHIARGELERAKSVAGTMRANHARHSKTGSAAIQVYQALKAEEEKAVAAGETARAKDLKGQMAEYLRTSNGLSEAPKFQNLRSESTLWMELGRFADAEATLRRTLSLFHKDEQAKNDVQRFVLPDLGAVLLAERKVPEAFQVLNGLVPSDPAEPRKPTSTVVRNWSRAVTGWVEEEGNRIVEIPGAGGAENLKRACDYLNQLTNSEKQNGEGAWSCPWYELTFETAYAYYQWSRSDSSKIESTRQILQTLVDFLADERLGDVADKCGNEALQRRYLWLRSKLR